MGPLVQDGPRGFVQRFLNNLRKSHELSPPGSRAVPRSWSAWLLASLLPSVDHVWVESHQGVEEGRCAGRVTCGSEKFPIWILIESTVYFTGERGIQVWHFSNKNSDILVILKGV